MVQSILDAAKEWNFLSPQRRLLHCALSLAVQCIVIGPVCLCVSLCVCLLVCLWVCYHVNLKLRESILTKLGLYVKVMTISS